MDSIPRPRFRAGVLLLVLGFSISAWAQAPDPDNPNGGDAQAARQPPPTKPDPAENLERPQEVPDDLDRSRRHFSENRKFLVSIHDLSRSTKIGKIHNWSIKVLQPDRTPVNDASIEVDGGMPAHNHGFPTRPEVTRRIGDGLYLIEGVKFNMTGWWRFEFGIRTGETSDRVRFNVVITD